MAVYETVIGLEVHAELQTKSKIFCPCPTSFGAGPNTQVCPVCLGHPGALPVLNREAFCLAVKAALALNCRINPVSKFDRKNYFYPDLPKAYQISQFALPVAGDGFLSIETAAGAKKIGITRVHLEEDAGKLIHSQADNCTLVDYNRSGVPLIEIVSEPDLRTPEEARLYLEKLKSYLRYTEVSDCKMEEGSLRCDANISLREAGSRALGVKVEVKNLNSFKAVEKALEYEVARQTAILARGGSISQETRRFEAALNETLPMRSKEEAHDYRYFPEPDLPPVEVDSGWLKGLQQELPELPDARKERFVASLKLSPYEAGVLTASRELADFFENCLALYPDARTVAKWTMGELLRLLKEQGGGLKESGINEAHLAELLTLIHEGKISHKMAKEVFEIAFKTGEMPASIIAARNMMQISDAGEIAAIIRRVIDSNPKAAAEYRQGKDKALGFLVGQVMKETRGQANPQVVNQLLKKML
ncbi:MAG TPA: Asp-tRNA(Asn)/Glu-tRNA(Gln) amidotransferase subunit GatB [Firmicutes bacterium]|nr:Asp-tRNA(Asn)/Glu-tRNA(Gln) amidotransferase subunit GatB [Bacillota bacterium]